MKLFVAGLPFDMDDQQLQDIFTEYGSVNSAKIINDRETGKSRGFGFVEFADSAAAQAAIKALDGTSLAGRSMTVKVAEDKPRSGGGGGDRGGNRNFSGGRGGGGRDRY